MGDWYPDPARPGRWIYDREAPSPGQNPAITMIFESPPAPNPDRMPPEDGQHAHGATE